MHAVRHNIFRNLVGQTVPLVVGLVTVPVALSRLGNYRFGLLSLAWLMLGYLGIFDFGIGRATVHYTSRAVASGDEEGLRGIVWSSVAFNTAVSTAAAFLLYAIARPHLVPLLHPAPALRSDCEQAFFWVCAGLPIVTISACLRAVLEGA